MPTYNRAFVLWKAILSIQTQTHPNWELIVVNDRSTDDTDKLMREFRNDPRIKYVVNKYSHSPAGGRKFGYELASGDFISYLDSDNTALPNWLEVTLELFRNDSKAVFVYPSRNFRLLHLKKGVFQTYVEETGYSVAPSIDTLWMHTFEGDPNGMVHRASAMKLIQGWDETFTLFEDYDYSLQLAQQYPDGMRYLKQTLINYTRLYGEKGICNDATYKQIVESLTQLDNKYKEDKNWKKYTWYKEQIEKYTSFLGKGFDPIDRIEAKYSKTKND